MRGLSRNATRAGASGAGEVERAWQDLKAAAGVALDVGGRPGT